MQTFLRIVSALAASFVALTESAIANPCDIYWNAGWDKPRATTCIAHATTTENARDLFLASHALRNIVIYDNFDAWKALYFDGASNPALAQLDIDSARAAISFLERSAKLGSIEAQYELGRVFGGNGINYYDRRRKGPAHLGALFNLDRAIYWYRAAAARGHVLAQVEAATLMLDLDVKGSLQEALRYLTSAAKQTNPQAAWQLALFFRAFNDEKMADILSEAWRLYASDLSRDESRKNDSVFSGSMLEQSLSLKEQLWHFQRKTAKKPPLSAEEIAIAKHLMDELRRGEFDDWGFPVSVKAALKLRERAEKKFKSGQKIITM